MVARILETWKHLDGNLAGRSEEYEFNPKQLHPTIGMKKPPSKELMKAPSRFSVKPNIFLTSCLRTKITKNLVFPKTVSGVTQGWVANPLGVPDFSFTLSPYNCIMQHRLY